jgi:putative FmdB family regulatory protein
MPTYDYVCSACGHEMEVVHGVHGHGPSHCPVCGGTMRKSFAAPAIHFKGSGWAKKERGSSGRTGSESAGSGSAGSGSPSYRSGGSASKSGEPSESTGTTGSTDAPDGGSAATTTSGSTGSQTD